jgi:hypothetical protein
LEDILYDTTTSKEMIEDMITHQPYLFKKLNDSSYEICAEFITDYNVYQRYGFVYPNALKAAKSHHKGQTCYRFVCH